MSINVHFHCAGCDAKTEGTHALREHDSVADVAPEGWHAFDPLTGVTYCPACWRIVVSDQPPPR